MSEPGYRRPYLGPSPYVRFWLVADVPAFPPHEGLRRISVTLSRKFLLAAPDRPREGFDVQAKSHRATRY
jgi:hypothetical protein